MKKILKRTVAVLLTVCLMASVIAPVSAVTIPGETVTQTKTYNLLPKEQHVVAGKTVYPADDTGAYATDDWYFWGTRETTFYTARVNANFSSASHGMVFKLNNIPVSADGKYTFTVNMSSGNATKYFYFIKPGENATFPPDSISAVGTMIGSDTEAGQLSGGKAATATKELGDYIVNGSVYIAFYGDSTGANFNLTSFTITYNVKGEDQEIPAATVGVNYSTAWGDYIGANSLQNTDGDSAVENRQEILDGLESGALNTAYIGDSAHWDGSNGYFIVRNNFTDANVINYNGIQANAGVGGYFVLKIASPGAGTYEISADYPLKKSGSTGVTSNAEFFFIPASKVAAENEDTFDALIADTTYYYGSANLRYQSNTFTQLTIAEGEEYYYVVVRNQASGKRIYLTGFSLHGTVEYMELTDAAAAATSKFHVVKLAYDHTGNINIGSSGYILDLNGYTVNGSIVSTGDGSVIDSTDGTGKVTGTVSIMSDNSGYLPLKDGTDTRFFKFDAVTTFYNSSGALQTNPVVDGDYVLMWFDMTFTNSAAYTLIASGNSGLGINASLSVGDKVVVDNIAFDTTVTGWAGSDHAAGDQAMVVAIANAAAAGEGNTIKLNLTYGSVAGSYHQIDYRSLSYKVPAAE